MIESVYISFVIISLVSFYLAFTMQKKNTRILMLFFTLGLFAMLSMASFNIEKINCYNWITGTTTTEAVNSTTTNMTTSISTALASTASTCGSEQIIDESLGYFFGSLAFVLLCLILVTIFQEVDELGVLL